MSQERKHRKLCCTGRIIKMDLLFVIILLLMLTNAIGNNIVYVILSQSNKFHLKLAERLKDSIILQYKHIDKTNPVIYLSHIDLPHIGGWTIFPLIPELPTIHSTDNTSWIFFLEDYTKVKVPNLLRVLEKYDYKKDNWIGHALYDKDATIIHHYAFHENPSLLKYPNVASGFAISIPLLTKLSRKITEDSESLPDFNIDKSYELALFLWNYGFRLTHDPKFCIKDAAECATFVNPKLCCDENSSQEDIYFAVKTFKNFHVDRVPVVKKTWGKHASLLKFFSNVKDESIPTVNLEIPNTGRGHCSKTLAILKYSLEDTHNSFKWIVVADDDTILSIKRLQRLLSCYDPSDLVVLGERYGFRVAQSPHSGYNYITGGGGMVFSRPVVESIVKGCKCPALDSPDDMYLGACLKGMGVELVHSPAFHQARPDDYSASYLESVSPVSFHKHWMNNPIQVYKKWFEISDNTKDHKDASDIHSEL